MVSVKSFGEFDFSVIGVYYYKMKAAEVAIGIWLDLYWNVIYRYFGEIAGVMAS